MILLSVYVGIDQSNYIKSFNQFQEKNGYLIAGFGSFRQLVMEAGSFSGVAGRAGLVDQKQEGVAVAVEQDAPDFLNVARGFSFHPELLPRSAPVSGITSFDCTCQTFMVHIGHHEDFFGTFILGDGRNKSFIVEFYFFDEG